MKIKKGLAEIQVRYSARIKAEDRLKIVRSTGVYEVFQHIFNPDTLEYQETFFALYLNRANLLLGYKQVSNGGNAGTVVDVKQVLGVALKCNATSVILGHNHPSGNLRQSEMDHQLTMRIKKGAELMGLQLLDHLIISTEGYYSMADRGDI